MNARRSTNKRSIQVDPSDDRVNWETVSHYRILKKLGAGGMGEAYLAEDLKLRRNVAIKFLPDRLAADELAKRRLLREAQAAAKLDHPNICAIHEVGEEDGRSFIVMQYVEGETLASCMEHQRLPLGELLHIATQVADALAEAQSHGITHRDIKPQNIMITPQGRAKVLDFGLAKSVRANLSLDSEVETSSLISQPGTIIGTVPYMSPEQVRGDPVDARSDIFSFGVVLYEMVSGHRPFEAESGAETISAILTSDPAPLSDYTPKVPAELQRILNKSLQKDREARYQLARELAIDLDDLRRVVESGSTVLTIERAATRGKMRRLRVVTLFLLTIVLIGLGLYFIVVRPSLINKTFDSIAILPLVNASADANSEYLSDGITENLINALSQLPQLRVTARTTVFRYKGRDVDPQTLGHDLNVRAVVTGRVFQVGDTLNIQTELVDASNGSQLWGQKYNRKVGEIFAVQEEIARDISEKLRLRLGEQERKRLAKRYTDNAEAYGFYMKGRYHLTRWTDDGFKKGIEYLNQAIALEPRYALAYAALGQAHSLGMISSPREASQPARNAINKALEIDDTLAEAHVSLAVTRMYLDWDWSGADREFRRAIELNPGNASAHHWYGWYLGFMGRFDESLAELDQAVRLDPLSIAVTAKGEVLCWAGRCDHAIEQLQKAQELDPNFVRLYLAEAYEQVGRHQEALEECEKMFLVDQSPTTKWYLGQAYALAGRTAEAQKVLSEMEEMSRQRYVPPYLIAGLRGSLGDKNGAFEWLEKAYEEGSPLLAFLRVDHTVDSLRSDARFRDLIRRVGLTQ